MLMCSAAASAAGTLAAASVPAPGTEGAPAAAGAAALIRTSVEVNGFFALAYESYSSA